VIDVIDVIEAREHPMGAEEMPNSPENPRAGHQRAHDGDFQPRILVLACNWCSYAGAYLAGTSRLQMPPNFRVVRVMCTGRVDVLMPLMALARGADGVLISGCHPGDCHYQTGNEKAWRRTQFLKGVLAHFGLSDRVLMVHVSAGEGNRFQEIVTEFTRLIRTLGPCPLAEHELDIDTREQDKRELLVNLLDWMRARIEPQLGSKAEVICEEMAEGFGEPIYDPNKCVGCGACAVSCPLENIELREGEGDRSVHYFHSRCVGCGSCEEACPEDAIRVEKHLDLVTFVNRTPFEPLRLPLKRCARCMAPFVPEKQLEKVVDKQPGLLQALSSSLEICPDCRRLEMAEQARSRLFGSPPLLSRARADQKQSKVRGPQGSTPSRR
jgi:F420-non-reducing hydrogenase iron-sulfur subunit